MNTTPNEHIEGLIKELSRSRKPPVLYHYTSGAGLLGILESKCLWASSIRFLNDSKEYELAVGIARQVIAKRAEKSGNRFECALYSVLDDSLNRATEVEVYVTSFTENGDQLSQWRGYTPPGAGYSIGFISTRLTTKSPSTSNAFLVRCVYDPDDHYKLITNVIDVVVDFALSLNNSMSDNRDRVLRESFKFFGRMMPVLAPALKDSTFKEEAEWRLVALSSSFEEPSPHFRTAASLLVPYRHHRLTIPTGQLPIAQVFVGPTPNPLLAEYALKQLLSKHALGMAKVCTSAIPYRTW